MTRWSQAAGREKTDFETKQESERERKHEKTNLEAARAEERLKAWSKALRLNVFPPTPLFYLCFEDECFE
jgi:hypothetical protein